MRGSHPLEIVPASLASWTECEQPTLITFSLARLLRVLAFRETTLKLKTYLSVNVWSVHGRGWRATMCPRKNRPTDLAYAKEGEKERENSPS